MEPATGSLATVDLADGVVTVYQSPHSLLASFSPTAVAPFEDGWMAIAARFGFVIEKAGCTPVKDFRSALPEVDVLTVHTPLTGETRRIIGERELAALKPGALVLNTARGGIVDEDALAAALQSGHVAGAGVDVFEDEPSQPDVTRALFACDNVIMSPHVAGVSLEAGIRMGRMSVRNVLDCFDGRLSPDVVVNKQVLERPARRA